MVEEINISKIAVSKISFDETNPNILTKEQMKSLKLVMEKFGFLAPVILNKDLQVIDGEHRVRVYQELGKKTIPAYVIDVNTINKKMLRQLMNKLRGEHDKQKDADEFKLIFEAGKLNEFSNLLATQTEDFQAILERKFDIGFEKAEKQEVPIPPAKPKAKLGDIYQLGKHRIMCGDSCKDLDKLMGGKKADMIWSDPPYGVAYEQGKYTGIEVNKKFKPIENDDKQGQILRDWIKEIYSNLIKYVDNAPIYVCAPSMGESFMILSGVEDSGFHMQSQLIWYKNQFILGRADYHWRHEIIWYGYTGKSHYWCGDRTQDTVWEIHKDSHASYIHPTQKPVELSLKAIKNSSKSDNIILDPFLGSGSCLIACEQSNRICYGMELDPGYIDVIITRWENHTGKKAKKVT